MNNKIFTMICAVAIVAGWFIGEEYKKYVAVKEIAEQNAQINECLGGDEGACNIILNR